MRTETGWPRRCPCTKGIAKVSTAQGDQASSPVLNVACAPCQGRCCLRGGSHAYLSVATIQEYRARQTTTGVREILDAYCRHLVRETYRNSCIFHTTDGCSLPAEMHLSDEDKMLIRPAKELRSLRTNRRTHQHKHLQPGKPFKPNNIKGSSFEMEVVISPMNSDKVGVKVLCSPDMQEYTVIEYDQRKRTLSIDSTKSSLSKKMMRIFPNCYASGDPKERGIFKTTIHRDIPVHTAPLHLEEDDMLKLDIFADNSIIEVFANNRQMITGWILPTRADSKEVYVFSEGGD